MKDFSSKRLIENPEKARVTSTFDLGNKRVMDEVYKKLNHLVPLDSIALQEIND